jgi:hypothetical protein
MVIYSSLYISMFSMNIIINILILNRMFCVISMIRVISVFRVISKNRMMCVISVIK